MPQRTKRFEEAEPLLKESYAFYVKRLGIHNQIKKTTVEQLISLYEEWGKPERAESYQKELVLAKQNES